MASRALFETRWGELSQMVNEEPWRGPIIFVGRFTMQFPT
jgi:hypothetical protein